MDRLYLDMDGVLMDFNAALRAHGVEDNETHFIHKPRIEWTPSQVDLDLRVRKVMELPTFWPSIPIMPDALSLWSFCQQFSPRILTATPNITEHRDRIAQQKRESIWQFFDPQFPATNIVVCLRAEKKALARPGAVLVDDMPSNCAEWEAHGGTAILHKNAVATIARLIELFRPRMVGADRLSPAEQRRVSAAIAISEEQAAGCNCPGGGKIKMNCPVHGITLAPPLRQKTSAERKAEPIHSAIMKYHPDAMAAHARLCVAGNIKHNGPDVPLQWARGKSGDHLDCAARHLLTPDAIDPETGETELTAAFWRLGCALQLQQERLLKEKGIMPYSGVTP